MRMTRRVVQGLIAAVVLAFSTGAACARDINYDFNVFLMGGSSTLFDGKDFTSASYQYHAGYSQGYKVTVGLGVPLGSILGIETAYTTGPNNLQLTDTSVTPRQVRTYAVEMHSGNVNVIAHAPFSKYGFRPYATAGLEYNEYVPTSAGIATALQLGFGAVSTATLTTSSKIGVNFGFGVERKLLRRVNLRLDVRDHMVGSPNFGLPPDDPTSAIFPVTGSAHNVEYSVGIVFHVSRK
jgi:hypothetical protein